MDILPQIDILHIVLGEKLWNIENCKFVNAVLHHVVFEKQAYAVYIFLIWIVDHLAH